MTCDSQTERLREMRISVNVTVMFTKELSN